MPDLLRPLLSKFGPAFKRLAGAGAGSAAGGAFGYWSSPEDASQQEQLIRAGTGAAAGAGVGAYGPGKFFNRLANRSPGEPMKWLPTIGHRSFLPWIDDLGHPLRAAVLPRYPGLDRAAGAAVGGRALDRTRQAVGRGLRWGSLGSMLAGGGIAANSFFNDQVPGVAKGVGDVVGKITGQEDFGEKMKAEHSLPHSLKFTSQLAEQALGQGWGGWGEKDPFSQAHGEYIRSVLPDIWRYQLHRSRETWPKLMGGIDALRSVTPLGMAATGAIHHYGKASPPAVDQELRRVVEKYAPEIAARPRATEDSPFWRHYQSIAARHFGDMGRLKPSQFGGLGPASKEFVRGEIPEVMDHLIPKRTPEQQDEWTRLNRERQSLRDEYSKYMAAHGLTKNDWAPNEPAVGDLLRRYVESSEKRMRAARTGARPVFEVAPEKDPESDLRQSLTDERTWRWHHSPGITDAEKKHDELQYEQRLWEAKRGHLEEER